MQLIHWLIVFCFGAFAWASPPMAHYPRPLANHDLCSSVKNDPDRKIPMTDWFCATADGDVFYRALGSNEFYHGFSYWLQGRTEFRPSEHLSINIRSILYSGSVSYGYAAPTGFYNVVGFSALWPTPILGGELRGRFMDLERQTIGAGLFIEEFDSAGVRFDWRRDRIHIKALGDGTGMLLSKEDTLNWEINYGPQWIGLGGVSWTESGDSLRRKPLYYLYSIIDWNDWLQTKAEVGSRNNRNAYLISLGTKYMNDSWNAEFSAQGRWYDDEFAEHFTGLIENLYISYDQLDKPYTNAKNVFVTDDNVLVYSALLNLIYEVANNWQIFALNEMGRFEYRAAISESFYFGRFGVIYYPHPVRHDSLTVYASNKVLNESLALPPRLISASNTVLFKSVDYYGIEAKFRF